MDKRPTDLDLWGADLLFEPTAVAVQRGRPIFRSSVDQDALFLADSPNWTREDGWRRIPVDQAREIGTDLTDLGMPATPGSIVVAVPLAVMQDLVTLGLASVASSAPWVAARGHLVSLMSLAEFRSLSLGVATKALRAFESAVVQLDRPAPWEAMEAAERSVAAWPGLPDEQVLSIRLLSLRIRGRAAEYEPLLHFASALLAEDPETLDRSVARRLDVLLDARRGMSVARQARIVQLKRAPVASSYEIVALGARLSTSMFRLDPSSENLHWYPTRPRDSVVQSKVWTDHTLVTRWQKVDLARALLEQGLGSEASSSLDLPFERRRPNTELSA